MKTLAKTLAASLILLIPFNYTHIDSHQEVKKEEPISRITLNTDYPGIHQEYKILIKGNRPGISNLC